MKSFNQLLVDLNDGQTLSAMTSDLAELLQTVKATGRSGSLRIYKNGAGYMLKARLKYRLQGGAVKFWYEMDRPEVSIDDAFGDYVKVLREKSGYQVLLGVA